MHIGRFLLVVVPFLLAGCVRDRIDLIVGTDIYNAKILSGPTTVEIRGSTIRLKPGARIAIKTPYSTQWLGQYEVTIVEGGGLNAYLRTVSHKFDGDSGVLFRWGVDGCQVRSSDGRNVPIDFNAELERQTLTFRHEAHLLTISAGCTKLYEEDSHVPATEYVILETLPNSTVDVTSIAYFETSID